MAMTRPFTCRAIARPFARLAIARFYVYGLMHAVKDIKQLHAIPAQWGTILHIHTFIHTSIPISLYTYIPTYQHKPLHTYIQTSHTITSQQYCTRIIWAKQ